MGFPIGMAKVRARRHAENGPGAQDRLAPEDIRRLLQGEEAERLLRSFRLDALQRLPPDEIALATGDEAPKTGVMGRVVR